MRTESRPTTRLHVTTARSATFPHWTATPTARSLNHGNDACPGTAHRHDGDIRGRLRRPSPRGLREQSPRDLHGRAGGHGRHGHGTGAARVVAGGARLLHLDDGRA